MGRYLLNRDGGKSDELGFARWMKAVFGQGVINTRTTTSWKVTQRGAGANLSVDVAAGDGFITINEYVHIAFSDATTNVTISTSDPTNPRIDTIVAYIDRSIVSNVSNNNPNALVFAAVAGTPAGSPTAPSSGVIQAAISVGNPYIVLANVSVAAATSNIVNANITDTRVTLAFAGRLYGGSSNTVGHIIPNVTDDTIALLNAAQTFTNKTLTNPIINGASFTGDTGWQSVASPTAVAYNGNRSYSLTYASSVAGYKSKGGRNRYTRTITAPTQCTDLESSSLQYYSKTSPTGMTWTDDFVVSAWVKLESYSIGTIASRYNGTSGWEMRVGALGVSDGRIQLTGYNGASGNFSTVVSFQSIPLGEWVHVAAQLDMSSFSSSPTTSYVMIDGLDVTTQISRGGTNPTALVQAGDFQVGASNSLQYFDGKIAQLAIYSAKVTQANIRATISQTMSGAEASLASGYSFNNSFSDLNANANNLTAQNSAVATNADSPFAGGDVTEYTDGTTEMSITTAISSDGLTETVSVPRGYAIPTTGGVSAGSYSISKVPYGFPSQRGKWDIRRIWLTVNTQSSVTSGTWYNGGGIIDAPVGEWVASWEASVSVGNSSTAPTMFVTLSTASNSETDKEFSAEIAGTSIANSSAFGYGRKQKSISVTSMTQYFLNGKTDQTGGASITFNPNSAAGATLISLENAYV